MSEYKKQPGLLEMLLYVILSIACLPVLLFGLCSGGYYFMSLPAQWKTLVVWGFLISGVLLLMILSFLGSGPDSVRK